MNFELDPNIWI